MVSIIAGPAGGRELIFDAPDRFLFGRAADASVSLPDDPFVSRHHFVLEIAPPDCRLTDLGSKNGTQVNDVRYGGKGALDPGVRPAPGGVLWVELRTGDIVRVGDTRMRVEMTDDAAAGHTSPATLSPPPGTLAPGVVRAVVCVRCGADCTAEAGPRGQVKDAAYTCARCRAAVHASATPRSIDPAAAPLADPPAAQASPPARAPLPAIPGYVLESKLGEGGMGIVYRARAVASGRPVAIKAMLPEVATSPESVAFFQREVAMLRQLRHPHIVGLLDHGRAGDLIYCVMELVEGIDLDGLIASHKDGIPLATMAPIMLGVLDGLAAAHGATVSIPVSGGERLSVTGVVHRDLKPGNILLSRTAGGWNAKIADFGLAKAYAAAGLTGLTRTDAVGGTPLYWPREQIVHYRYLDPASDVFSAAAVFYHALTGRWIRDGLDAMTARCRQENRSPGLMDLIGVIAGHLVVPIRTRLPSIPVPVADAIDRALRETEVPADGARIGGILGSLRYKDAGAFAVALRQALAATAAAR